MSKLYQAHKGLGLFSSRIPLIITPAKNNESYLISTVEHFVLMFRLSDLAIIGTSDRLKESILSVSSTKNLIFCGCKSAIFSLKRAKTVFQKYSYQNETDWKIVVALEEEGLLCGVSSNNFLVIWDITTRKEVYVCEFPANNFDICQLLQPKGYTNKIVVASTQGSMHLINFKTRTTLYTFDIGKQITVLKQTPDDNTVAIGCADGSVLLHNLLYDKTVAKVHHDLGAISSIGIREDLPNELVLLAGSESGHVTLWNLDKGMSIGQARDCHQGAIASLLCVPGRPLLVTNGPDNSVKVWNYERPDGTPLLANSRSGHWLPPLSIGFWPSDRLSTEVMSGGADGVMRVFSTAEERLSFSMGRAYRPHKGQQTPLSGPTDIAMCAMRDGVWDSLVAVHGSLRQTTTWSVSRRARGRLWLDCRLFRDKEHRYHSVTATAVDISSCGNFAVVGYSSGHVVRYNLQSGLERGLYGQGDGPAVVGVAVGLSGGRAVIVSVATDGLVAMYDIQTRDNLATAALPRPATLLRAHPHREMVAVATDNGAIYLLRLDGLIVFRRLWGDSNSRPITDMAFWHDEDRIVAAAGSVLRTFDIVGARLVDVVRVAKPITRVAVSPGDQLLVTAHQDELGLSVWAVQSAWTDTHLEAIDDGYEPIELAQLPRAVADDDDQVDLDCSMAVATAAVPERKLAPMATPGTTFAALPASFLCALLDRDRLTARSEMAVRGVSSTPFFLPEMTETLHGIRWKDSESGAVALGKRGPSSSKKQDRFGTGDMAVIKDLHARLTGANTDEECDGCLEVLAGLSSDRLDEEMRLLHPLYQEDGRGQVDGLLRVLANQMRRGRRVDLCRAVLAVALKHNLDCLLRGPDEDGEEGASDPRGMMEASEIEAADARKQTLELLDEAIREMRLSAEPLVRDLNMVEQMALFASHK